MSTTLTGTWYVTVWRIDAASGRTVETGQYVTVPFRLSVSATGRGTITDHPRGIIGNEQPQKVTHTLRGLNTTPAYGRGQDNSGKWYETITWVGTYHHVMGRWNRFGVQDELEVQTWDGRTIYVRCEYLHRKEHVFVSTIAELDEPSQQALAALLSQRRAGGQCPQQLNLFVEVDVDHAPGREPGGAT
ncbi:MAG: hypothetical protein KKA73_09335 [Chloroflexi bacterium]|nr:hypothetical protein [Chloroflexota bacterium]MBU1747881.1 hypothetical protein [Chloroflexota bacterium]